MTDDELIGKSGFAEDPAAFEAPRRKPMAQRAFERNNPSKRAVNLTASAYWVHEAKALKLNLSALFDEAVEKAVRDIKREQLKQEMAEFGEWQKQHHEKYGFWNDRYRRF